MIEWEPMRDAFRVSGVYCLRWWRDPDGQEYLVHGHGSGSARGREVCEDAVYGRDLLTGRRLAVLLRRERATSPTGPRPDRGATASSGTIERVVEHRTGWEIGTPDPTWGDVRRLAGIEPARDRGGPEHLDAPSADALCCHPVAIGAHSLLVALDLPAHALTCPECCKQPRLIEHARERVAQDVGDAADGTWHRPARGCADSMVRPDNEPIDETAAWRAVFDEIAATERFCRHASPRWGLERAWTESGWAAAAERLPAAVAQARVQLERQRRGEMDADGQTKLVLE